MKKIICLIISSVMIFSLFGCGKDKAAVNEEALDVNVTVENVKIETIENTVTYMGEIKASEYTSITSKVSANAKEVYKKLGDFVEEGEELAKLDDTDYRLSYNQAKAAYNQAKANYNSITNGSAKQTTVQLESSLNAAKIEYNDAKTNYDNQKILYENGAISKLTFDAAQKRLENAQLNLNTAQTNYDVGTTVLLKENAETAYAALESARVGLEVAENSLSNTVIRAPISGYISSENISKGQMVSPGIEIFSIKATDSVNAEINVTESVIGSIKLGAKAVVKVKSADYEEIEGTVTMVSPTKDDRTGMYAVKIAIENADGTINDGMFAEITLTLSEAVDSLVVPSDSVLEDENGDKYVYIVENDLAKRVDIETGIISEKYTEAVSGVKKGDKVVVSGKEYLSEQNNRVKIVD